MVSAINITSIILGKVEPDWAKSKNRNSLFRGIAPQMDSEE
jgi:hypothetical protein